MPKYLDGAGLSHFWESIKPKLGGVVQSGTGTVVSSDDAANLPPLSLTIHGKSVQDGTPSPSSPVPIESVEPTSGTAISLVLSDGTAIPIDLQGHALRSLPDGTEDTLEVDGEGNVTLTKRVGSYTITGDETVTNGTVLGNYRRGVLRVLNGEKASKTDLEQGGAGAKSGLCTNAEYLVGYSVKSVHIYTHVNSIYFFAVAASDADLLSAYTGATVLYPLATPQTISLGRIDLPPLPSPSFSMHVDALVSPTLDAEWWTQGGGKVVEAVSTRIAALEDDVAELQGQVPEREVLYDTSTWTIVKYGRTVMVQVHGATATPSTSTALVTGILSDCKPAYNCSATVLTSSGSSTQAARMAVYADTGNVYIVPAGYTSSASWYGTLTYIY